MWPSVFRLFPNRDSGGASTVLLHSVRKWIIDSSSPHTWLIILSSIVVLDQNFPTLKTPCIARNRACPTLGLPVIILIPMLPGLIRPFLQALSALEVGLHYL
jgi:hypothetical protein